VPGGSLAEEGERDVAGLDRLPLDHAVVLPDFVGEDAVELDVPVAIPGRGVVQPASPTIAGVRTARTGAASQGWRFSFARHSPDMHEALALVVPDAGDAELPTQKCSPVQYGNVSEAFHAAASVGATDLPCLRGWRRTRPGPSGPRPGRPEGSTRSAPRPTGSRPAQTCAARACSSGVAA